MVNAATCVFEIRLPEPLARRVEAVAREQKTDVNEFVQWALRVYLNRLAAIDEELNQPIDPSNSDSMTMAQVSELIQESRRDAERKSA